MPFISGSRRHCLLRLWAGWELLTMNLLAAPGGKEFWKERGYVFGNEYRDYVEKVILTRKPDPEARPLWRFQDRRRRR